MVVVLTEGDSRKLGWQMLKIDEKIFIISSHKQTKYIRGASIFRDAPFVNVVCYRKTRVPEVSLDENKIAIPLYVLPFIVVQVIYLC
jgi:hypothetical protein